MKKSETLEVRLSQPLKDAFMGRCRADGVSASETVRALIEGHLAPAPKAGFGRGLRFLVAAAAAVSVGAIAAPTLARPSPTAVFAALDTRHVGRLSFDDFAAATTVETSVALTHTEFLPAAFRGLMGAPPLRRTGALDPALNRAILQTIFEAIDTNHDGAISFEEFRRYYYGA